jgi:fructose-specific phosphotransferase system IIC component
MKKRRWPYTFIVCAIIGTICLVVGIIILAGFGGSLHPLLADDGAGIFMIVSAVAFFLTGAFPLVLRRLAEREDA